MKFTDRANSLNLSATIALSDKIREQEKRGAKIINLAGGQPGFPTPDSIKEAAIEGLNKNHVFYSHSRGIPELRNLITDRYNKKYGLFLDFNKNVLITPGCKQALLYCILSLVDNGDEVIIPTPSWMTYIEIVKMAGGIPIEVNTSCDENFKLSADLIEKSITSKTKVIILNSPNNPTGQIIDKNSLRDIYKLCLEKNIFLLCDEIYDQLIFSNNNFTSIACVSENLKNCALINGFSKSYSMTGWRLGYVFAETEIIDVMVKFQQNSITCPTTFIQFGAMEALNSGEDFILNSLRHYQKNLDFLIAEFAEFKKFKMIIPQGGFYAFVDISMVNKCSHDFCLDLLERGNVSAVPGGVFGKTGEGYIRINLAVEKEMLEEFVNILKRNYEYCSYDLNLGQVKSKHLKNKSF